MKLYKHHEGKHIHALLMFSMQLWWGKKSQHSDGLVYFSCRRDPFQSSFCPKQRRASWLSWLLSHAVYCSYGCTFFSHVALRGKTLLELPGEGRENILKMRSNLIPTTSLYPQSNSTILKLFCLKQLRKH